jgi:hypothetical protein
MLPIIKQAQIWCQINKRYASLKMSDASLEEIVASISDLENSLKESRQQIPLRLRVPEDDAPPSIPPGVDPELYLGMIYSYLGSLIQIHSILVYPWNRAPLKVDHNRIDELRKHGSRSTEIVINSSRRIIQYLQFVNINAATPKW